MRAVILCDGDHPETDAIQQALQDSDLFIAADGGGNRAHKMNLIPDVIIGDMDSYIRSEDEKSEIIHDPDQDTNDLEKALHYAHSHSIKYVTVYGATGLRVDHTLKNLSVLLKFNPLFRSIHFADRYSKMYIIESPFQVELPVGTSVSLFPISGRVENIRTRGLRYTLQNETLENGVLDGTSNQTTEKRVEIEFEKGDLLFLINHNDTA